MNDLNGFYRGRAQLRELILVINDKLDRLEVIRTHLQFLGIPIATATSGMEGWDLFERERPGLVVLDLVLEDMDGYDWLRQMRKHPRGGNVAVIATHPYPVDQDVFRACQIGKDCF